MRAAALALLLGLWAAQPALAQDPVFDYSGSDAAMNAAIADARATLPLFLEHGLDAEGASLPRSMVKVALPTLPEFGGRGDEHIWIMPFRRLDETRFRGVLANEPAWLGKDVHMGDQVDFSLDQISDWGVTSPDGLFQGHYTTRQMHKDGAFGEAPFDSLFTAEPVPGAWK